MDFEHSAKAQDYIGRLQDFMDSHVFPAEQAYEEYRNEKGRDDHTLPPVVEELKAEAAELKARRGPLGADLPEALLALYERLREQKDGVGAAALRAGDPAGAGRLLAEALRLWRGEPVADALRLHDVRLAARIDLLAASAECGAVAEHVAELTELADEHPLDERLGALRMRALAESGRQAEALAAYETLRSALDDELGAMPSAVLQEAHLAVLRGEVAVAGLDRVDDLRVLAGEAADDRDGIRERP